MSYILDALRKAERERHLGQPPSLTAPPPSAEPRQRRLGPWLGVGLGLGLNAALLAFFLHRTQPATPPTVTALPAPMAPAPAATPSAPPAIRSLPAAREPSARRESPDAAREPTRPVTTTTVKSTEPASATPRKEPTDKPATPESSRPTVPPTSRERREEQARPPVAPGSVTLAPESDPVLPLETLSADARRGIPTLNLDIHIHSADPDKRFVVINGRRYREGDRLGEGPVLETVTHDGAILRQGGQRFRLSVRR